MATLPDGVHAIAVTPVNFDDIIKASTGHPFEEAYTEEKLREIRSQARANNAVAYVCFMDDTMWHKEEPIGRAVHDTGDWRGDR